MSRQGRPVLGKGLNALLPFGAETDMKDAGDGRSSFKFVPLGSIKPNPFQPRELFDDQDIRNLSESIRKNGMIQPLALRETEDGQFELIAGERRLRAARLAGLRKVPVIIRQVSRTDQLLMAIIENVQRRDLNPLEEAEAYHRLKKEFGFTQEDIAKMVGKERSTVANAIRIRNLPEFAKQDLLKEAISAGHARVLLALSDNLDAMRVLRDKIVNRALSVRQAELLVQDMKKKGASGNPRTRQSNPIPKSYRQKISRDLGVYLSAKSRLVQKGDGGRLEIEFSSIEDLERLLKLIIKDDHVS